MSYSLKLTDGYGEVWIRSAVLQLFGALLTKWCEKLVELAVERKRVYLLMLVVYMVLDVTQNMLIATSTTVDTLNFWLTMLVAESASMAKHSGLLDLLMYNAKRLKGKKKPASSPPPSHPFHSTDLIDNLLARSAVKTLSEVVTALIVFSLVALEVAFFVLHDFQKCVFTCRLGGRFDVGTNTTALGDTLNSTHALDTAPAHDGVADFGIFALTMLVTLIVRVGSLALERSVLFRMYKGYSGEKADQPTVVEYLKDLLRGGRFEFLCASVVVVVMNVNFSRTD